MNALTVPEKSTLHELEGVIESGLKTFVDVGLALVKIRDARLYRAGFKTFEEYCKERWGMSRIHAFRMIQAAGIAEMLPTGNKPESERQARPLTRLDPEDQPKAWSAATEKAAEENRPVTAKDVEVEVNRIINPEQEQEKQEVVVLDAVAIADKAIFYMTQIGPRMKRKEEAMEKVIAFCNKQIKAWRKA